MCVGFQRTSCVRVPVQYRYHLTQKLGVTRLDENVMMHVLLLGTGGELNLLYHPTHRAWWCEKSHPRAGNSIMRPQPHMLRSFPVYSDAYLTDTISARNVSIPPISSVRVETAIYCTVSHSVASSPARHKSSAHHHSHRARKPFTPRQLPAPTCIRPSQSFTRQPPEPAAHRYRRG